MGPGPVARAGRGTDQDQGQGRRISPTDLVLRGGYLKDAIPLPPDAVLGFEAAGTVDAVGLGVTGTSAGDAVTALLFSLGGYAEYAVASIWTRKPDAVHGSTPPRCPARPRRPSAFCGNWTSKVVRRCCYSAAADPVGIIATQLAVARGVTVISVVSAHDETLARELGAHASALRSRAWPAGSAPWARSHAVFDAAGTGILADAIALAGGPERVITLSDPAAADFGVTLSEPAPDRAPGALDETIALLASGRLRLRAHRSMPMQQAAEAHRQLESGTVHERIILTVP